MSVKFDVVTIFPSMVLAFLEEGVIGRANRRRLLDIAVHDLREFSKDRNKKVDDMPYGGGPGMVMKPEPFMRAMEKIKADRGEPEAVILVSPQGKTLKQAKVRSLSRLNHVVLLCGRYEAVDERVADSVVSEEISIGDYVLTGGEVPALVILEAVARLAEGVVGDAESVKNESFERGLLDYPHYTRPADVNGARVPEVLLSGNHEEIRVWRKYESVKRTLERRPDLLDEGRQLLDEEEKRILETLQNVDLARKVRADA